MSGVRSVSSNANDPYGSVQSVGNDTSINAAEPIQETTPANIVEAESEQKLEKALLNTGAFLFSGCPQLKSEVLSGLKAWKLKKLASPNVPSI